MRRVVPLYTHQRAHRGHQLGYHRRVQLVPLVARWPLLFGDLTGTFVNLFSNSVFVIAHELVAIVDPMPQLEFERLIYSAPDETNVEPHSTKAIVQRESSPRLSAQLRSFDLRSFHWDPPLFEYINRVERHQLRRRYHHAYGPRDLNPSRTPAARAPGGALSGGPTCLSIRWVDPVRLTGVLWDFFGCLTAPFHPHRKHQICLEIL